MLPLTSRITSDAVLASFFIPQLGSQLYAMPGKQARQLTVLIMTLFVGGTVWIMYHLNYLLL